MTDTRTAFVFPGQGSQKIGMLADLADRFPSVQQTFAEASDVLGYDLWDRVQNGEVEQINQTECTQPLLLTASTAVWQVWGECGGPQPALLAGHSLGEWSALVAAGVVDFSDAVGLVQKRGRYMQNAVPQGLGIMAAVMGLEADQVAEACSLSTPDNFVAAVNFNAPDQIVIAGHADAIYKATARCKELGAKRVMPLPVSAPFHTPLMQPAADQLAEDVAATEFRAPQIPVLHNVTVAAEVDPHKIRQLMVDQITAPVPWVKTVQKLRELGATALVECGPGRVVSGLVRRIDRDLTMLATESVEQLDAALAALRADA